MSPSSRAVDLGAALLVFFAAAAGAEVIAADFLCRQSLAVAKKPLPLLFFKAGALAVALHDTGLIDIFGDKVDCAAHIVLLAGLCVENGELPPLGGFRPLFGGIEIKVFTAVGVQGVVKKIDSQCGVGAVAGAHQLLGGGCSGIAANNRFTAGGKVNLFSAVTFAHNAASLIVDSSGRMVGVIR